MIIIDMDMPECWDDCRFNNGCECCLIDAVCTDETAGENGELPSFCPIKCNLEDIKDDIYCQPSRKKGHWVSIDDEPHEDYECDRCWYVCSTFTANINPSEEYKFCPNCGADMGGIKKWN